MSEMIRRMVTAYRASMYEQPVEIDWDARQHQAMAAAVEVLREPTPAMLRDRCNNRTARKHDAATDPCVQQRNAATVWRAMVDSALEPTPPTGRAGE